MVELTMTLIAVTSLLVALWVVLTTWDANGHLLTENRMLRNSLTYRNDLIIRIKANGTAPLQPRHPQRSRPGRHP